MRELERPEMYQYPIQTGPNVAEFAFKEESSWADDFLKNETHVLTENIPSASGWSQEFLDQPGYRDSETNYIAEWETQWDNLTSHIGKPDLAVHNNELAKTASNIVASMNDPKFSQSKVYCILVFDLKCYLLRSFCSLSFCSSWKKLVKVKNL